MTICKALLPGQNSKTQPSARLCSHCWARSPSLGVGIQDGITTLSSPVRSNSENKTETTPLHWVRDMQKSQYLNLVVPKLVQVMKSSDVLPEAAAYGIRHHANPPLTSLSHKH